MWDDWDVIEAAQRVVDEAAEQRRQEGIAPPVEPEPVTGVNASPGPTSALVVAREPYMTRFDPVLGRHVAEPLPVRPPLDDAAGIRLWINDLRAAGRRLRSR